jgi:hypothetical protein
VQKDEALLAVVDRATAIAMIVLAAPAAAVLIAAGVLIAALGKRGRG